MSYYVGSSLVEELFNMVLVLPKWVTPHTLASPPNSGQRFSAAYDPSVSQSVFTITEKAPTRVYYWLKVPTSSFTFKTLLRHYAQCLLMLHSQS